MKNGMKANALKRIPSLTAHRGGKGVFRTRQTTLRVGLSSLLACLPLLLCMLGCTGTGGATYSDGAIYNPDGTVSGASGSGSGSAANGTGGG